MLHGCGQDAAAFALATRMNRLAARERFLVLYPEQDRLANANRCWNWHELRSRRAHGEAAIILAAIDQVCLLYPVDRLRVGIAGLSAGAGMAAFIATRYPERIAAVVMHSGVPPGLADSTASALRAMRGQVAAPAAEASSTAAASSTDKASPSARASASPPTAAPPWPPLLVIHGSRDRVVSPSNATAAARLWAARAGVVGTTMRRVQRGARYPMTISDFGPRGRAVATLCEIEGLGHAWSGGDMRERFSDPRGPDASRMAWSFMARRFRTAQASAGELRKTG
jgi:poly(hydroxyalkanoate) depolymerase family esterase